MPAGPIRVLIVDDSALMREMLARILSSDPGIEVIGTARDPMDAREKIKRLNPDVLTLDVEMPGMNGIAFLEKIMALRPMPVVMISTLTQAGALATIRALEIGALDCVAKPTQGFGRAIEAQGEEIVAKVKAAAGANVNRHSRGHADAPPPLRKPRLGAPRGDALIAIGASTGGVEAIGALLKALPDDLPPIVIVQHMPYQFTASFAERLDSLATLTVRQASDGEPLSAGTAYIAPGGRQFEVVRTGARYACRLGTEDRVSGHCPSVDVLFRSLARLSPQAALGIILTGMGRDGAAGLLEMRLAGAQTVGQDEASSVVYGMPKAAFENGAIAVQLPLPKIADYIVEYLSSRGSSKMTS